MVTQNPQEIGRTTPPVANSQPAPTNGLGNIPINSDDSEADFIARVSAYSQTSYLGAYPKTLAAWFRWKKAFGTWPTAFDAEVLSKMSGENWNSNVRPGGGGGSRVNRANTIRSLSESIFNQAASLGLGLTNEEISYIANVAFDQDFSSEQLTGSLIKLADWNKLKSGTLTATYEKISSMAANYFVPLSKETMQDYAKRLSSNQITMDGIESFIRSQARISNPWLSEYIDQGINPSELLRSARDQIANSLGLNASDVNFSDSRFMNMVTVSDNGQTRLANSREIGMNIRSDKDWAKTDEALAQTSSVAKFVAEIFGRSVF